MLLIISEVHAVTSQCANHVMSISPVVVIYHLYATVCYLWYLQRKILFSILYTPFLQVINAPGYAVHPKALLTPSIFLINRIEAFICP